MTLDDLRADYEAHDWKYMAYRLRENFMSRDEFASYQPNADHVLNYWEDFEPHDVEWYCRENENLRETLSAARLYEIARDEGMSAAVLWKLANPS